MKTLQGTEESSLQFFCVDREIVTGVGAEVDTPIAGSDPDHIPDDSLTL